ncbi:MAG TPA: hypothetical protein PLO89_01915 [Spirochaetota bacterium]|nr:hypothetical protein [Spirochaetota bacterium]
MKKAFLFFNILLSLAIFLVSGAAYCYPVTTTTKAPTTFVIENMVSGATMSGIKWSEFSVYSPLLPGSSSPVIRIYDYKFQNVSSYSGVIKFNLEAKSSVVYLETVDTFSITEGDRKTFTIDDNTKVKNPLINKNIFGSNLADLKSLTVGDVLKSSIKTVE